MAEETILETRGLTKEFKGFVAVKDVSLKVRRGSIHALIGPNGAGKTTSLNLLTHLLEPTRSSRRAWSFTADSITFNASALLPTALSCPERLFKVRARSARKVDGARS